MPGWRSPAWTSCRREWSWCRNGGQGAAQLYLNGRLPGYRAAFLLSPAHGYPSVALASKTDALPAIARVLGDLQQPLTGDDLSREIDAFAA